MNMRRVLLAFSLCLGGFAAQAEEVAKMALFLASDDARFVNGESIVVDGGLTALGPDLWHRFGQTYERDLTKNYLTRGTTGEESTQRKLSD